MCHFLCMSFLCLNNHPCPLCVCQIWTENIRTFTDIDSFISANQTLLFVLHCVLNTNTLSLTEAFEKNCISDFCGLTVGCFPLCPTHWASRVEVIGGYHEYTDVKSCQDVVHLYHLLWSATILNIVALFLGIITAAVLGGFKDMVGEATEELSPRLRVGLSTWILPVRAQGFVLLLVLVRLPRLPQRAHLNQRPSQLRSPQSRLHPPRHSTRVTTLPPACRRTLPTTCR